MKKPSVKDMTNMVYEANNVTLCLKTIYQDGREVWHTTNVTPNGEDIEQYANYETIAYKPTGKGSVTIYGVKEV